jgi:hypothetical protein
MKSISPVIGDGLQDFKELFLQSKKVVIIWLADDGRLGVQSILEELCNFCWWRHYFLGARRCPKSMKIMTGRTKALAIESWTFLSVMETFLNPRAHATVEMHFTVKAVSISNFSSI